MAMQVGLQLYSVRNSMEKDALGTIEQCAEIGYKYLQIANGITDDFREQDLVCGFGVPADVFRDRCENLGVKLLASHFMNLTAENTREICKAQKEVGVPGLITPIMFAHTVEDIRRNADQLNAVGEVCRDEGMTFYYHNHSHEWQKVGGRTIWEQLLEMTDPELVKIELDTFWCARGGNDPSEVIRALGSRCDLLHQKDFPAGRDADLVMKSVLDESAVVDLDYFVEHTEHELFAEVGTGILPIQKFIDTANEVGGYESIILEQDYTALDEIESIRISMEAFRKYTGIVF